MYRDGQVIAFEMAAAKIYKGDIVRVDTTEGYANSADDLSAGDMCVGVALDTVDNSLGSAGDKKILVDTEGVISLLKGTPAKTDAGTWALQATTNQQTVTSGAIETTGTVTVGAILGIAEDDMTATKLSATRVAVYLLTMRQAKTA